MDAVSPGPARRRSRVSLPVRVLASALLLAATARAEDAAEDFRRRCFSCHTIGGGRLTGPDLKDVEQRKDRAWLVRFVVDPEGVLSAADPYALELLEAARGVRMPRVEGMTEARAEALLDLIRRESEREESEFTGAGGGDPPHTPEEVARGRALFEGRVRLLGAGPPCLACHTVGEAGGLGGGALGPDLTRAYERYRDRRSLEAWLRAPATPTMRATFGARPFGESEVRVLVGYLAHQAAHHREDESPRRLRFVLLALGASLLLFGSIRALGRGRRAS